MGDDVYTTKQLVSGEMQAAYEATRGPTRSTRPAFNAFSEASNKFLKDRSSPGSMASTPRKDIAAMDSAEKAKREASGEYQILCAELGDRHQRQAARHARLAHRPGQQRRSWSPR